MSNISLHKYMCVTTTITNLSVDDDKYEDIHLLFVIGTMLRDNHFAFGTQVEICALNVKIVDKIFSASYQCRC